MTDPTKTGGLSRSLAIAAIAAVCHAANRAYQEEIGEQPSPPWHSAPEWQRESAIAGVTATLDGSASTPEEQHETWCAQKFADGWVYGAEKDAVTKTHPCLVPYDELPEEQRAKDRVFRAIVVALAPAALEAQLAAIESAQRPFTDPLAVEVREPTPHERQQRAQSFGPKVQPADVTTSPDETT